MAYIKKPPREFAVYKGEEILTMGTKKEICEELGIKGATFDFCRSKTYLKRMEKSKKNNYRTIVRIDNEE